MLLPLDEMMETKVQVRLKQSGTDYQSRTGMYRIGGKS